MARRRPSGWNATARTSELCCSTSIAAFEETKSHTRTWEAVGRVEEVMVEAVAVGEVGVGEVVVVVAALPNRAASAGRILACAQRRMMYSRTEILCG